MKLFILTILLMTLVTSCSDTERGSDKLKKDNSATIVKGNHENHYGQRFRDRIISTLTNAGFKVRFKTAELEYAKHTHLTVTFTTKDFASILKAHDEIESAIEDLFPEWSYQGLRITSDQPNSIKIMGQSRF